MDDASLDEFLDSGGEQTGDEPDAREASDADADHASDRNADDAASRDGDVEPATATLTWSPGGTECESCGGTVARRWNSEAGLVCTDCKEW